MRHPSTCRAYQEKRQEAQRKKIALDRYKQIGDKWIINTEHRLGSVRPIDLISGDPDEEPHVLREFDSKAAVIDFEEEWFQEKERPMKAKENPPRPPASGRVDA